MPHYIPVPPMSLNEFAEFLRSLTQPEPEQLDEKTEPTEEACGYCSGYVDAVRDFRDGLSDLLAELEAE